MVARAARGCFGAALLEVALTASLAMPISYDILVPPQQSCEVDVVAAAGFQKGCGATASYQTVLSMNVRNTGKICLARRPYGTQRVLVLLCLRDQLQLMNWTISSTTITMWFQQLVLGS